MIETYHYDAVSRKFTAMSPTSKTLTKMIKSEYPTYNLDAFSDGWHRDLALASLK